MECASRQQKEGGDCFPRELVKVLNGFGAPADFSDNRVAKVTSNSADGRLC